MKKEKAKVVETERKEYVPHRLRLPGFILNEDVGLGSVVKRVTSTFGIRHCGGCEQRAAVLNRWLVFTGSRRK